MFNKPRFQIGDIVILEDKPFVKNLIINYNKATESYLIYGFFEKEIFNITLTSKKYKKLV